MGSMQCNVKVGYQLSICSATKENHGKPWSSWLVTGPSECNWLLASSPAWIPRNLTLVPTLCSCNFPFSFVLLFVLFVSFFFSLFSQQVILFFTINCIYGLHYIYNIGSYPTELVPCVVTYCLLPINRTQARTESLVLVL
jgi:hypothetical protein